MDPMKVVAIHETAHAVVGIHQHRRLNLRGPALKGLIVLDEETRSRKSSVCALIDNEDHWLNKYDKENNREEHDRALRTAEAKIRYKLAGTAAVKKQIANSISYAETINRIAEFGGTSDWREADSYLRPINDIAPAVFSEREIEDHLKRLFRESAAIVEEFWDDVVRLADELYRRKAMTFEEVQNLQPPLAVFMLSADGNQGG